MTHNDIKKALYKASPQAKFLYARKGNLYYGTGVVVGNEIGEHSIIFTVPVADIGDADFLPTMEAKLLIRYIQTI